jgi:spore maturation protein CgeB
MSSPTYSFVIAGLSITSSWGNGHATTYRALIRELHARGHRVLFLERDLPFYRAHSDEPQPSYCDTELYGSVDELEARFGDAVRHADVVMMGSYVPEGPRVGAWLTKTARGKKLFYDIDTPITLQKLEANDEEYLAVALIPRFDLYLSFTGGPTLALLETRYGAARARPLYCSVDAGLYYPEAEPKRWTLGYLGTYSDDRQPTVDELLCEPARALPSERFIVAGPQYPEQIAWPANVERVHHLPPGEHRRFYNAQRFTLNVTRRHMVRAGYSPSVRLFEAAACGTPIISDVWPGIDAFFSPEHEILLASSATQVRQYLSLLDDAEAAAIGARARARILQEHTAAHRVETLEGYVAELFDGRKSRTTTTIAIEREQRT